MRPMQYRRHQPVAQSAPSPISAYRWVRHTADDTGVPFVVVSKVDKAEMNCCRVTSNVDRATSTLQANQAFSAVISS
jgi:hypothetical protein